MCFYSKIKKEKEADYDRTWGGAPSRLAALLLFLNRCEDPAYISFCLLKSVSSESGYLSCFCNTIKLNISSRKEALVFLRLTGYDLYPIMALSPSINLSRLLNNSFQVCLGRFVLISPPSYCHVLVHHPIHPSSFLSSILPSQAEVFLMMSW